MNEMKIFAGKTMQGRVFWSVVCLIAVVYFIARGPLRGYESAEDFASILDSSRCWTLGLNPYLPTDLETCSLDHTPASTFATYPEVHPPSTLLLLAPLARLPFPVARGVWITLLLTLTVLAGVRLARAAPGWDLRVSCFVMAFSPIHTALRLGQPSILTCALIALSLTVGNPWWECCWVSRSASSGISPHGRGPGRVEQLAHVRGGSGHMLRSHVERHFLPETRIARRIVCRDVYAQRGLRPGQRLVRKSTQLSTLKCGCASSRAVVQQELCHCALCGDSVAFRSSGHADQGPLDRDRYNSRGIDICGISSVLRRRHPLPGDSCAPGASL